MKPLYALYGVVGAALLSLLAFAIFQPIKVLPRMSLAPALTLLDQSGALLTNEDLRGKIALYNFTYTRCVSPCLPTTDVMRMLQAQLSQFDSRGYAVRLVTISIDELDSIKDLQGLAQRVNADTTRWKFATGEKEKLKYALGGGFNLYYAATPDGGITVDPLFVLVDGWGIIRAEYRTASPAIERILRDIQLVITEAQNSVGAGRYAYEAAHLFLCYPK